MAIGHDSIPLVLDAHHCLDIFPGGEKRGAEREQQKGCAREQLVVVTVQRKRLLQRHGGDKGPGCVILALDTHLSRTRVRRDALVAGLQGPCPDTECQPPALEPILPVPGWQPARLICQSICGIVFSH